MRVIIAAILFSSVSSFADVKVGDWTMYLVSEVTGNEVEKRTLRSEIKSIDLKLDIVTFSETVCIGNECFEEFYTDCYSCLVEDNKKAADFVDNCISRGGELQRISLPEQGEVPIDTCKITDQQESNWYGKVPLFGIVRSVIYDSAGMSSLHLKEFGFGK